MNAYLTGYKKSKGEIIFFVDSDDYFKKKSWDNYKFFLENKNLKLIFDLPFLKFEKKKKKMNFKERNFFY